MKRLCLLLAAACLWGAPCLTDEAQNISIAEAMVKAINDRNLAALDNLVAPDVVRISAATAGVTISTLDDFKRYLETDFSAVPDSVMKIDIIFGNEQFVAMRAVYAGTQQGQMGPFPPNRQVF